MLGTEPEDERAAQRCVQDAHEQMQRLQGGDPAQALNAYARLRQALAALPPAREEVSHAEFEELKSQLQWGFDARLSAVMAVAARVAQLGKVEEGGRQTRQQMPEPQSNNSRGSRGRTR